jgi:hypothetical protein
MSFTSRQLREVAQLAEEVAGLALRGAQVVEREQRLHVEADPDWSKHHAYDEVPSWLRWSNPVEAGRLRRRSMDLTRALSKLRKP